MAVILKSRQEIGYLREAGRLVAETFEVLRPYVVPGVSTAELDKIAEDFLLSRGGKPIYKGYGARPARGGQPAVPPFPATICASVNDVICHGIPSRDQKLREGDIIGVDIGVIYKGWVGDSCVTYAVGKLSEEAQKLMDVTKKCMELGIEQAPGRYWRGHPDLRGISWLLGCARTGWARCRALAARRSPGATLWQAEHRRAFASGHGLYCRANDQRGRLRDQNPARPLDHLHQRWLALGPV